MATKSSTKKTKADTTKKTSSKKTAQKHDLIYIMSNSCGWCKKANPIVDELKSDGHEITTLDVMIPEEGQKANELKQKYEVQCGTPLFIDAETGNQVCGFREKDVLEKWANGEEIPKPPQPKGMPPRPPQDIVNASKEELATFKKGYEDWAANNKHLPNVLSFDQAVERIKAGQAAQQNQPAPTAPPTGNQAKTRSSSGVAGPGGRERGTNKNITYYYIIEGNERVAVFANADKIMNLTAQYYVEEDNGPQAGALTKVVGDSEWNNAFKSQPKPPAETAKTKRQPKPQLPKQKEVDDKVKSQIQKVKEASQARKSKTAEKSKTNKKTIESF